MRRPLAAAVVTAVVVAACGGDDDAADPDGGVTITGAWARATPGGATVGAVYLSVTSDVDDELVGATVDPGVAATAQLHATATSSDGTATMEQQDALAVPAGGELVLEPIGNHLMLVGLADALSVGESFEVTLEFAVAGDEVVQVEVREDAP